MQIEYTSEARELLDAPCFAGNLEDALRHLGPILIGRADSFGRTYAKIAGREIRLRVVILNGDKAIIDEGRDDA